MLKLLKRGLDEVCTWGADFKFVVAVLILGGGVIYCVVCLVAQIATIVSPDLSSTVLEHIWWDIKIIFVSLMSLGSLGWLMGEQDEN